MSEERTEELWPPAPSWIAGVGATVSALATWVVLT